MDWERTKKEAKYVLEQWVTLTEYMIDKVNGMLPILVQCSSSQEWEEKVQEALENAPEELRQELFDVLVGLVSGGLLFEGDLDDYSN